MDREDESLTIRLCNVLRECDERVLVTIASFAFDISLKQVATKVRKKCNVTLRMQLLKLVKKASNHIPLLLNMGLYSEALHEAIAISDIDLSMSYCKICLHISFLVMIILLYMKEKLRDDDICSILTQHLQLETARKAYLQYCKVQGTKRAFSL